MQDDDYAATWFYSATLTWNTHSILDLSPIIRNLRQTSETRISNINCLSTTENSRLIATTLGVELLGPKLGSDSRNESDLLPKVSSALQKPTPERTDIL